jgi:hypothetical protein
MTVVVSRLFDQFEDAEKAVVELERMGISEQAISLISSNDKGAHSHRIRDGQPTGREDKLGEDVGIGVGLGAMAGGAGGLLAGLGALTIPGFGPVIAAGWLAATAAGAVGGALVGGGVGGLIGSLAEAGMSEDDAHVYAEGVRRGSTLVSAKVPDELAQSAEVLLDSLNGVRAGPRGRQFREDGWAPSYETNARKATASDPDHPNIPRA